MSHSSELSKNTINLSHQNLSGSEIQQLVRDVGSLDAQQISTIKLGFNNLRDEGSKVVADVLSQNSSITCLDLGFCSISDEGVEALAKSLITNTTLKILYLSGNSITEVGFQYLGSALSINRSLEALYLTGNSGKADGALCVAKGLLYNTSLNKLFLNGNRIDKEGASSISDALATNNSITHLNLSDNNIGDSGIGSLSEALMRHRRLTELELSFSKITSVGMSSFVDCLVGYHSLRRLLLDNNKLGDHGAKSLAQALPHMSLMTLNIGFNEISNDGLLSILGYLSSSQSTLMSLCLSGNTIDNIIAKELANMLIVNGQLQELFMDRSNLTNVGERFIATGIASNKLCPLRILTGFELGKILTQLGSPPAVAQMNNEQSLKYLCQVWRDLERTAALQQQQLRLQQQAGYLMAQGHSASASTQAAMLMMMQQQQQHHHHLMQQQQQQQQQQLMQQQLQLQSSHPQHVTSMSVDISAASVDAHQPQQLVPASTIPSGPGAVSTSGAGSVGTSSPSELSATEIESSTLTNLPANNSISDTPAGQMSTSTMNVPVTSLGVTTNIGPAQTAGASAPVAVSTPTYVLPQQQAQQPTANITNSTTAFTPQPKRLRSIPSNSSNINYNSSSNNVINRTSSSSSRPPSRTPPVAHTRQVFQQQQLQQLQYQQQVERYHALLEAARQVPDLPYDARELHILTDFYYIPPSAYNSNHAAHHHKNTHHHRHQVNTGNMSPFGANHGSSSSATKRATTVTDMTKSAATTTTTAATLAPSSSNRHVGIMAPTAATLAQLGHRPPSTPTGPHGAITITATGTATCTSDDNGSDTGTQTTAGHVHERSEGEEDEEGPSSRPWKRASNVTTLPRINYFARIKSLLDELRASGSYGACLALLRQLRMLEISLLGLDALEIEEILLRDVLGVGRVVFHAPVPVAPASASAGTSASSGTGFGTNSHTAGPTDTAVTSHTVQSPATGANPMTAGYNNHMLQSNISYQNNFNYNYSKYLPAVASSASAYATASAASAAATAFAAMYPGHSNAAAAGYNLYATNHHAAAASSSSGAMRPKVTGEELTAKLL